MKPNDLLAFHSLVAHAAGLISQHDNTIIPRIPVFFGLCAARSGRRQPPKEPEAILDSRCAGVLPCEKSFPCVEKPKYVQAGISRNLCHETCITKEETPMSIRMDRTSICRSRYLLA